MEVKGANVTIRIDADLVKDAKVLAARRHTSLSRLIAAHLRTLLRQDQAYAAAKQRALARLSQGYDLGWRKPANRSEAHDRESLR